MPVCSAAGRELLRALLGAELFPGLDAYAESQERVLMRPHLGPPTPSTTAAVRGDSSGVLLCTVKAKTSKRVAVLLDHLQCPHTHMSCCMIPHAAHTR